MAQAADFAECRTPVRDGLIAATALVDRMTVLTRNVADFEPISATVFNPWANRSAA